MKLSKFTITRQLPDQPSQWLLWNTLMGSVAVVEESLLKALQTPCVNADIHEDELQALTEVGFVVPEGVDEGARFNYYYNRMKCDTRDLLVQILPTYDCNLRCEYCYQHGLPIDKHESMSSEVVDAVVRWLGQLLFLTSPDKLHVGFFGGEPLMEVDLIEHLATEVCRMGEDRTKISFGISTNGVPLTSKVVDRLVSAGVTQAGVSVDGSRSIHDERRSSSLGGTFDLILNNLRYASGRMKVTIVVKLDRHNVESIPELLDEIVATPFEGPIELSYGFIIPTACGPEYPFVVPDSEKPDYYAFVYEETVRRGLRMESTVKLGACMWERDGSVIIDPKGNVYNCISGIGLPDFYFGNVRNLGMDTLVIKKSQTVGSLPVLHPECQECAFLPVCRGGCPYERLVLHGTVKLRYCNKVFFEGYLRALKVACQHALEASAPNP